VIKELLETMMREAMEAALDSGALVTKEYPPIEIAVPGNEAHGDYATNIAMLLAKSERKPPIVIAECIKKCFVDTSGVLADVRVEKPGFFNFFLKTDFLATSLSSVLNEPAVFGKSDFGKGSKVLLEFVSANPTGPLHIGHGRGAVVGDVLGRILEATGHRVHREYYVNDAGNQMAMLGKSAHIRYRQSGGEDVEFPENLYSGDYIKDIAADEKYQSLILGAGDDEEAITKASATYTSNLILENIKDDLKAFRVDFDDWFSEKSLFDSGTVDKAVRAFEDSGHIYEEDDARWLKSSQYGDEKDRVVVRKDGRPTYLASDIAYHQQKFERGFERCINIWGADHHGYLPRVKASLDMLGIDPSRLEVLFVQFVSLRRSGRPVQMSTRAGQFEELSTVVEEVGVDAARFFFLMRSVDSALEFDLDLAKEQSSENPVFYVQYAHARTCSLFRQAEERGAVFDLAGGIPAGGLRLPEEHVLAKTVLEWPGVVQLAAERLEPHHITFYLMALTKQFHGYYNAHRVLDQEPAVTKARLCLVQCVQTVLKNGLDLLGVTAPGRM